MYLIRQQNIDILDISIVRITQQYLGYIEILEERRMELAADYLVMAALLAEIKSKLLLPAPVSLSDQIEEDPRMELVRRLQAYEHYKNLALLMDQLPRIERDIFSAQVDFNSLLITKPQPDIDLSELIKAMHAVLERQKRLQHHHIFREPLSVRERMNTILQRLQQEKMIEFNTITEL